MRTIISSSNQFNDLIHQTDILEKIQFVGFNINQKDLIDLYFEDCKFDSIIFNKSNIKTCFFKNCDFLNCSFVETIIQDTAFSPGDYSSYFSMVNVTFTTVKFKAVSFSQMKISNITLSKIEMDLETEFADVYQSEFLSFTEQNDTLSKYIKIPLQEVCYEVIESDNALLLACLQSALQKTPTQALSPSIFKNSAAWKNSYEEFQNLFGHQIAQTTHPILLTLLESIRQLFANNIEPSFEANNDLLFSSDDESAAEDAEDETETEEKEVYFLGPDPNWINTAFILSIEWVKSYYNYYQSINYQFFPQPYPKHDIQKSLQLLKFFYRQFQKCIDIKDDDTIRFINFNSEDPATKKRKEKEEQDDNDSPQNKFVMI